MRYIFFILPALFFACKDSRTSSKPERKDMTVAVYSSVRLEPLGMYQVKASVAGFLESMHVEEGDEIKAGDLLFVISDVAARMNLQNAELSYQMTYDSYRGEANVLEEMRVELNSAVLKMRNDSLNYKRFKVLYDQMAVSEAEFENVRLASEVSSNAVSSLRKKVIRKEKELKNQLAQLQNNIETSVSRTNDFLLKSIMNGKVYETFKQRGDLVNLQEPLAIIGDAREFVLKMLIDEVDISKVDIGQKVLVNLEAYKGKLFEARVTRIAQKMDERTQTFEIEATFIHPPSHLYMGLTGEGNIIVEEKRAALVIPREYLQPGNKVETDKGLVSVTTGLSNWTYVEIVAGLNEGTVIYKPE
jgi:multidrug efflux pump subunit AcrA (membrane-fusion protein)